MNLTGRNQLLWGGGLVATGLVLLIAGAHALAPDSRDFLRGFVLGLSGVLAVAGLTVWRRKTVVRRLQESAVRNGERKKVE